MALHGSLLDVHGVGVLLLGPSGVGKSECALELVTRGHRLVADDVVELEVRSQADDASAGRRESSDADAADPGAVKAWVVGTASERIRDYMEIRGLGIVCIPDLFGAESMRGEVAIDLVCRLEPWRQGAEYERVGLDRTTEAVAGVMIPSFRLPARPGGSMATIVELAAREHLQRRAGVSAASRLDERLRDEMRQP